LTPTRAAASRKTLQFRIRGSSEVARQANCEDLPAIPREVWGRVVPPLKRGESGAAPWPGVGHREVAGLARLIVV
jgi:hypothetical protein